MSMSGTSAAAEDGAAQDADDVLMVRYRNGDSGGFDVLYQRYKGAVYRFFLRQMPKADAEECHQEVWLKVIRSRDGYQARGEFRAYLFTIAHRTLTDRYRKQLRRTVTDPQAPIDEVADDTPGPEAMALRQREAARLYRLIGALPIAQREALLLKEEGGLGLAEIARITDTSEEGMKSRLRYAMQKLRAAMATP
jgi:RNA polymerase sigma-70 factor, ECF subfamily